MKLFIKYSEDPPYLPEAVAGSAAELARYLGIKEDSVRVGIHRGISYFKIEVPETEEVRHDA